MSMTKTQTDSFSKALDLELQRAKRYRVFVSMTVFDLSFLKTDNGDSSDKLVADSLELIRENIRAIDSAAVIGEYKIGLLLPETPRQGAEVSSRRIAELLKDRLATKPDEGTTELVPLEMLSYPDAAGARSFPEFLTDMAASNCN